MSETPDTILHQDDVEDVIDERIAEQPVHYLRAAPVALVAGTKTVADVNITANSLIRPVRKTAGGTVGALYVTSKTPGTGYVLGSTSSSDTSVVVAEIDYDG